MTKTSFSTSWKRSIMPGKQRKYRYNAPLHVKQKFIHTHLSPELRKKHGLRNVQIKTGDKVRVLRGQNRKKEGKVERVNLKLERVYITGLEYVKKEGGKVVIPFVASNLMIIELNLSDKKRKSKLNVAKVDEKKDKKVESVKVKDVPKELKEENKTGETK
jgi:large subunit ribosomal protein L24